MNTTPPTKPARKALLTSLISAGQYRSQAELLEALAEKGFKVTQATLSRDLSELEVIRGRNAAGEMVYLIDDAAPATVPPEQAPGVTEPTAPTHGIARLAVLCKELLLAADGSANIAVLHTPPGAAQFLASAIDGSRLGHILGTIAGDDSIMVVSKDPTGGKKLAEYFLDLAAQPTD